MRNKKGNNRGFTLVELLVAMGLASILLGAILYTFKSQQDSYVVQSLVTRAQQNVRAAIYMISRDIQMAGYYTNFDKGTYSMNWDDLGGAESARPLIYARDNLTGGSDGIQDNTDLIVIVKASQDAGDRKQFVTGESASGSTASASLRAAGNLTRDKCALLVKGDLTRAEFFQVQEDTGAMSIPFTLDDTYTEGDWIYRADVIIYYVSDDPDHPSLMRKNLGNDETAEMVAEDIDNLQFRYLLANGNMVNGEDAGFDERDVRGVEISILARTREPVRGYKDPNTYNMGNVAYSPSGSAAGYRRRLLNSLIKTRNIGL